VNGRPIEKMGKVFSRLLEAIDGRGCGRLEHPIKDSGSDYALLTALFW